MANVEFQEEKSLPQMVGQYDPRGMSAFIISLGLAKNEKQAQLVLASIAGVMILIALAIPVFFGDNAKHTKPSAAEVQKALSANLEK